MKKIGIFFVLWLMACTYGAGVNESLTYQCGGQIVDLVFSDDETIVINISGQNYVLNQVNTSVGEQYMNEEQNIMVVTDGNDVYVTINGVSFPQCAQITK